MKRILQLLAVVLMVGLVGCQSGNTERFAKRYQYKLNHGRVKTEVADDKANTQTTGKLALVQAEAKHEAEEAPKTLQREVANSQIVSEQQTAKGQSSAKQEVRELQETEAPSQLSFSENRAARKEMRKQLKEVVKRDVSSDEDVLMFVVLLILAIILPPLAVYLKDDNASNRFWINLILWILGWGGVAALGGIGGLLALLAVVHAILIVADII